MLGRCKYCGEYINKEDNQRVVNYCGNKCADRFNTWAHCRYNVEPPYLIKIYYEMSPQDRLKIDTMLVKLMEENNKSSETSHKAAKTA